MRQERCGACRFWQAFTDEAMPTDDGRSCNEGDCRLKALAALPGYAEAVWPNTKRDDWCGEWQPVAVGVRKAGPRQRRVSDS